ncbi:MAG: hypothetical protein JWM27_1365 [Gemmatimonadetes bacterium]|nr:hypothetical protein [Gemmatimonadota bacterium]
MPRPGSRRRRRRAPFAFGGVGPPSMFRLVALLVVVMGAIWYLLRFAGRR